MVQSGSNLIEAKRGNRRSSPAIYSTAYFRSGSTPC
jgi:hypothetical protein